MAKLQLDQVIILLADKDRGSRDSIRNILYNNGFRALRFASSIEDIEEHFKAGMPDLLIADLEMPDGDICEFVRKIRNHDVGQNPFLPVITTTWAPTPQRVKDGINSGVDDILPKPISSVHLSDRIMSMVGARKPFVVTSDYIGPDRHRSGDRPSSVPLMEVPNTLKAKATGDGSADNIQAVIDAAIADINIQKIERHSDEISKIVVRILPELKQGNHEGKVFGDLEKLFFVSEDTERRMAGTDYEHICELCQSLNKVVKSLMDGVARGQTDVKDVQLLMPLSQAISMSFTGASDQDASVARQISATVAG